VPVVSQEISKRAGTPQYRTVSTDLAQPTASFSFKITNRLFLYLSQLKDDGWTPIETYSVSATTPSIMA